MEVHVMQILDLQVVDEAVVLQVYKPERYLVSQ